MFVCDCGQFKFFFVSSTHKCNTCIFFYSRLSTCEILELLDRLEEEDESVDELYIAPPDAHEESDCDSADEDQGGLLDNLSGRQLQSEAECVLTNGNRLGGNNSDEGHLYLEEENENIQASIRKAPKRRRTQKESISYNWKATEKFNPAENVVGNSSYTPPPPSVSLVGTTPYEKFLYFFDDEVLDLIVMETNKYAASHQASDFTITKEDVQIAFGILLYSGYVYMPGRRMYWSTDEDTQHDYIASSMPRNKFDQILQYLHVADNNNLDKNDKMAKLRPLMRILNRKFCETYMMDQNLDLDESMIEYFGRHGCKQCIRNKPIRFGFKAWSLNSPNGYLLQFDIYQGSGTIAAQEHEEKYGKGGGTLLNLIECLPDCIKDLPLHFYFDNYFTGLPLITKLTSMNYGGTGTIRDNRVPKSCTIVGTQAMKKSERGAMHSVIDTNNKISMTRWKDNSVVTVASNIHGSTPKSNVSRWSSKDKKKVSVPRPNAIAQYNENMGGTDRMDQNINMYRVSIRKKKWWWTIFTWLLDVSLQNAWILHKNEKKDPNNLWSTESMSLLEFRRQITRTLISKAPQRTLKGRPQQSRRPVISDIRFDNVGHLIQESDKQAWQCGMETCKSRPKYKCIKCKVPLCPKCFIRYHERPT